MSVTNSELRLAIIGCGRTRETTGATGYGMSHAHMGGYRQCPGVRLVAVADICRGNAEEFAQKYGGARVYEDYKAMLKEQKPDVVSISTWPALHCEMVLAAAEAGAKAIHCEKPMAPTFGESRRMVQACRESGTQLTFNHQRRFNAPFRKVRELLRSGRIGKLLRIETTCGNLFDWGTHWFDMMFFYNDENPARWVIGQIETRGTHDVFGAPCEGQGLAHIKFSNGVHGLMVTGYEAEWEAVHRLIGTEGTIEVEPRDQSFSPLRIWARGESDWTRIEVPEGIHGMEPVGRGVIDLIDALRTGREPELSADRALRATELIFATYESSRRRGRVDLPLEIDDSPLQQMLGRA